MNILLINTNPVVSRLLILCTRDDAVTLKEVSALEKVEEDTYDVVLVDEASFGQEVSDLLLRFDTAKKVFISYDDDEMSGFDMTIKKPFLPSQILELIQNVQLSFEPEEQLGIEEEIEEPITMDTSVAEKETYSIFPLASEEDDLEENTIETTKQIDDDTSASLDSEITIADKKREAPSVLDEGELERIKALLDMDEQIEVLDEILSDEALEIRKMEVIKEQLIADGLEIVEEDAIVGELSIGLDGTVHKNKNIEKKNNKSNKKPKKLKLTEKNKQQIEDAVRSTMSNMTKKEMKKLLKGKEIEVSVKLKDNN